MASHILPRGKHLLGAKKEDVSVTVTEHSNDDVTVDIIAKESTTPEETKNMANTNNTTLNVDPNKVPVKYERSYVDLGHACKEDVLDGATLQRTGEKELTLSVDCGDEFVFDTERLLAVIYRAADLPISAIES